MTKFHVEEAQEDLSWSHFSYSGKLLSDFPHNFFSHFFTWCHWLTKFPNCLLATHNPELWRVICTGLTLLANCTTCTFSQSESSNFFLYIIRFFAVCNWSRNHIKLNILVCYSLQRSQSWKLIKVVLWSKNHILFFFRFWKRIHLTSNWQNCELCVLSEVCLFWV